VSKTTALHAQLEKSGKIQNNCYRPILKKKQSLSKSGNFKFSEKNLNHSLFAED
jgi:hypothetical protein